MEQLGDYKVQREVDTDTTHVVSAGKRRTVNVLKAILSGCWLLSVEWVLKSLEKGTWLNEEPFELAEDFPAAKVRTKNVSASTLEPELTQELEEKYNIRFTIPARQSPAIQEKQPYEVYPRKESATSNSYF